MLKFEHADYSIQGRRPTMEDEILICPHFVMKDNTWAVYCIFDGHGGTYAPTFLKKNFVEYLLLHAQSCISIEDAIVETFKDLDFMLLIHQLERCDSSGSCCIALLCNLDTSEFWVANLGDSRAMYYNQKNNGTFAMSIDHKPSENNEHERIIQCGGKIRRDDQGMYRVCDRMGNPCLAISRAFGDPLCKPTLDDLEFEKKLVITSVPEIKYDILTPTTKYIVLACDGLWDVATCESVTKFVNDIWDNNDDLHGVATKLVEYAFNDTVQIKCEFCSDGTCIQCISNGIYRNNNMDKSKRKKYDGFCDEKYGQLGYSTDNISVIILKPLFL